MNAHDVQISTTRLLLRPLELSDRDAVFRTFTANVARYMTPSTPKSIIETEAFIGRALEGMEAGNQLCMAITLRDTDDFVGCCALYRVDTNAPELGIWVAEEHQGHGYGREAVRALNDWATANLHFEYLTYPVARQHQQSRRIPEVLGGVVAAEYETPTESGKVLDLVEYRVYPGQHP